MSKLEKLLQMAKQFKLGDAFTVRGMDAKIIAYSDEHVFFSIPELAVDPDEIDLQAKRARDLKLENANAEIYRLQEELRRLMVDPSYYNHRRERELYNDRAMRDRYNMMDYMRNISPRDIVRDPFLKGPRLTEYQPPVPGEAPWIDPLPLKVPSQKKSK